MGDRTTAANSAPSTNPDDEAAMGAAEPQPESGFIDREDRQSERQSSPTNPRVANKPESNQEEA